MASSFIEGFQVNARHRAKEELAVRGGLGSHDDTARAVLANVAAMESALRLADSGSSFDVGDVRSVHAQLMDGTRDARSGGLLRAEQNWIGGTGLTPCTAEFVPPPPEKVEALLADLCTYASGDEHPALVQAALVHAQFETIHPFLDGNGRTGRALIHVVLRRRGLASAFVPPISLVLVTHADRYVTGLTRTRYDAPVDSAEALRATTDWLELFALTLHRPARTPLVSRTPSRSSRTVGGKGSEGCVVVRPPTCCCRHWRPHRCSPCRPRQVWWGARRATSTRR